MSVSADIRKNFLINSSETGRHIVRSLETGKEYYVECLGDPHLEWGSLDQATGKMTVKKGWKKYRGSIDADESLITKENGFDKVHDLPVGINPLYYINELDKKYRSEL